MLGNLLQRAVGDLETFCLRAKTDDSLDFFWIVGFRRDNEKSCEEIWGNAVSSDNVASSANNGIASIRSEYNYRRDGRFEGTVEIGEAFNVEHVNLPNVSFVLFSI